jgi:predicted glycosyltransferase
VLVPFAQRRETEQTVRALCLERRGRVAVVAEAELSPERLAAAVERAAHAAPASFAADLDGAATSATIVADLCRRPPP